MPLKGKMALHFLDTGTGFSVGQVVYFPEIGKVVNQYQVIFATEGEVISSDSFPGAVGRFLAHQRRLKSKSSRNKAKIFAAVVEPESSYNPTSHKATTIQTLTRRAQLVCDSPDSLADKNNYLKNVFNKNYNKDFVRRNTYKDTEPNITNNNTTPVTTVTIPYVKGTSETIARILQPYNIRVAHKPITTLRQLLRK